VDVGEVADEAQDLLGAVTPGVVRLYQRPTGPAELLPA
jgi:hypothetical protein